MISTLLAVAWVVFWVYWILAALKSRPSRIAYRRQFFRGRLAILCLVLVTGWLFRYLPGNVKTHLLGTSSLVAVIGLILYIAGVVVAVWARRTLGSAWGLPMTSKDKPRLVISGPYAYIRHPIYSGLLLMALGSALDVNTYWLIVFIGASVFFIYSALIEEKLLSEQLPKEYPRYMRSTKRLLPLIW